MAKQTGNIDLKAAKNAHDEASKKATNYISADNSGIMVYDGTNGEQTPSNPSSTTNNVFIDPNSLDIRRGTDVLAMFGADGAVIGKATEAHTIIDEDGMQIYSVDANNNLIELANIGYGEGQAESGTTIAPYYTLGQRRSTSTASPYDSTITYSLGDLCVYDDMVYVCVTDITTPEAWNSNHWDAFIGNYSVAEGSKCTACGHASHAEGSQSKAIGASSHAEGFTTIASGYLSHAEGFTTTSSGNASHAEGNHTKATGAASHAEGNFTKALGNYSHTGGRWTIANYNDQTVIGRYNDNQSNTAFEIGNGRNGTPSNAFTVDWDGGIHSPFYAGFLQMFAGSINQSVSNGVVTTDAPDGWLLCDGSAVSRTIYATLFATIGTAYGSGDGSTTFNIPDMRGKFPLGVSSSHPITGTNSSGGSEDAIIPNHTHPASFVGKAMGNHHHPTNNSTYDGFMLTQMGDSYAMGKRSIKPGSGTAVTNNVYANGQVGRGTYVGNASAGTPDGTVTTSNPSNGVAVTGKNMPPYRTINYIICTGL